MFIKSFLSIKNPQVTSSCSKIINVFQHFQIQTSLCINRIQICHKSSNIQQSKDPEELENERKSINLLWEKLKCSKSEAESVYKTLYKPGDPIEPNKISEKLNWLLNVGATLPVILKNCTLLLKPKDLLESNYDTLSTKNKWKQTKDFVPLLIADEHIFKRICSTNPVNDVSSKTYYFAKKFKIEPHIMSAHFSKHLCLLELKYSLLQRKLRLLLDGHVMPEYLLRDLRVLACSEVVIKTRLAFIHANEIDRIMPWMIKCSQIHIERSIKIRKNRANEQNIVLEYLTKTLNWHGTAANSKFCKYIFLQKLNLNEATSLLNFLLKYFTAAEITENIWLLALTEERLQKRMNELSSLKIEKYPPNVLAMKNEDFKCFLEQHPLSKKSNLQFVDTNI